MNSSPRQRTHRSQMLHCDQIVRTPHRLLGFDEGVDVEDAPESLFVSSLDGSVSCLKGK